MFRIHKYILPLKAVKADIEKTYPQFLLTRTTVIKLSIHHSKDNTDEQYSIHRFKHRGIWYLK
jgi:hypothetical protein